MTTDKPERWWLSASEAAELVGVTPKSIKRWMAAKKMPGYRLNRTGEHRVLVVHFMRYCRENEALYALEKFNERYTAKLLLAGTIKPQSGDSQSA